MTVITSPRLDKGPGDPSTMVGALDRDAILVWDGCPDEDGRCPGWRDWADAFLRLGVRLNFVVAIELAKIEVFERLSGGDYELVDKHDNDLRLVNFGQSVAYIRDIVRGHSETVYDIIVTVCNPHCSSAEEQDVVMESFVRLAGPRGGGHSVHALIGDWNLKVPRPKPEGDYRVSDLEFAKTISMSGRWVAYRTDGIAEAASQLVDKAGWRR